MSELPSYVTAAKPVPQANRVPWYKSTAQTYAGIMLWFVFWDKRARQRDTGAWRHPGARAGYGDSRCDRRGPDLPLCQLSCPGLDGHEDGPAAGRRRHLDLRSAGRIPHARLLHGHPAVRLVGGQRLLLRRSSLPVLGSGHRRCRQLHLAIGVVWAIVAAFVGLKGIHYVAKVATYLPLIPLVILLILAAKTVLGRRQLQAGAC